MRAGRGASLVSSLMFVLVFAIFIYKIASRYGWGDEPAWSDELSVILFIWIIFWANAFVLREQDHIRFDLLYHPMPRTVRRVMAILRTLLIGGTFLCALPSIVSYTQFLWREHTPVLQLPLDYVYSCFAIFASAVVVRSFWSLARLLGPDWRRHI
ncbi:MAG: TRAP transporter small permease [Acetobacteraceae bacterium]